MGKHVAGHDYALPEFGNGLCAFRCSSGSDIAGIVDAARRMSKGGDFVIAIRDIGGTAQRFVPAYVNALIRKDENSMHSASLSLEIMMLIAGTMNIGKAIGALGANDSKEFIIFSNKRQLVMDIASKCGISLAKEISLVLDVGACSGVALTALSDGR